MDFNAYQALAVLSSFLAGGLVLELIRRRKLQDVLWLPWLTVAAAPAVLGLWIRPWATFARWLGVLYEPLVLVGVALLMAFAMLLYLSVVMSTLLRKNLALAQEVALLRAGTPPGGRVAPLGSAGHGPE